MNFDQYLKISAAEINQVLGDNLSSWNKWVRLRIPHLTLFYTPFIQSVLGGKVLRGTLVRLGYQLTGAKENSEILKIAAMMEILHASLLIQDDIADQSPIRRGKPSLHRVLGDNHYGISQAIFLGDLGLCFVLKIIAESHFAPARKNQAVSLVMDMIIKTILGQMLDIEYSTKKRKKKEEMVLTIHALKTAYYTIVGPLSVGAILGGASESKLKKIMIFGRHLGLAFQIQDDILGVFGDEKTLGKSVTSDIEEGKNTLLISYALKNGNSAQKKILRSYYGQGEINSDQHQAVREVFEKTGALAYSRSEAQNYVLKAKKVIPSLTNGDQSRRFLRQLADFLVHRDK